MHVNYDEIKSKIRRLKKLEIKIRFSGTQCTGGKQSTFARPNAASIVWDEFFDLHELYRGKAKYSIREMAVMSKEELKAVINEFFFNVYYRFYKENGIVNVHIYDPDILAQMGLPPDAGFNEIKKKFRELAKKYHPDTGGDSTKFIELMETYKKLMN